MTVFIMGMCKNIRCIFIVIELIRRLCFMLKYLRPLKSFYSKIVCIITLIVWHFYKKNAKIQYE